MLRRRAGNGGLVVRIMAPFGPRSVPLDYKYCPAREGLAIMICCCVVVDVAVVVIAVVIVTSSFLSSKI